jgi:hypothetical protein
MFNINFNQDQNETQNVVMGEVCNVQKKSKTQSQIPMQKQIQIQYEINTVKTQTKIND